MSDYYLDVITRCADMPLFKAATAATSQAAKASQTRGRKSADHRRIVAYLASRADGATDEEIADGLAINPSTVTPSATIAAGTALRSKAAFTKRQIYATTAKEMILS
jgi:hypothetical protein